MEPTQAYIKNEWGNVRDLAGDGFYRGLSSLQVNAGCGEQALHNPEPLCVSQRGQGCVLKVRFSTSRQGTELKWHILNFHLNVYRKSDC